MTQVEKIDNQILQIVSMKKSLTNDQIKNMLEIVGLSILELDHHRKIQGNHNEETSRNLRRLRRENEAEHEEIDEKMRKAYQIADE